MGDNKNEGKNRYRSYHDIGTNKSMMRVDPRGTTTLYSVSGETVSFAAGAAGTTGTVNLAHTSIANSKGGKIGDKDDTSFAWVTGTILTREVAFRTDQTDAEQLAELIQGDYAIDYDTGLIRYCKATSGTSDTCNYKVRMQKVDTELTVEGITIDNVKVFSTDGTAANSKYGFAMTDGGAADGTKHAVMTAGFDAVNNKAQYVRQMKGDAAANAGYHLSVAGEVVDFNTGAGTDFTPSIGVMGASSSGAVPVHVDTNGNIILSTEYADDSADFTVESSKGIAIMGVATSDTVNSGDIGVVAMSIDRDLHVKAKIWDGTTDALVTSDKELYVATAERNKPSVANATGSSAIATSLAPASHFKLLAVTVHFSAAPTTSENLTITLNANDGAAYDTTLVSINPSLTAATDIVYIPDGGSLVCESGDAIDVAFANTDARTYGLRIVYQLL